MKENKLNFKAFYLAAGVTFLLYFLWVLASFIPGFFTFMMFVGCFAVGAKLYDIYLYLYNYWSEDD